MFLGIDVGTSSVKALLLSDAGVIVDQSTAPLAASRPVPLWSEQSPADWWAAAQIAVGSLGSAARRSVRVVGITGQMHGATVLDRSDEPLRPAILWNDGRSFAECAELEAAVPTLGSITGNLAMPGFTAPKLLWLRKHERALFDRIATVLLPKDFVRLRMTGEKASDLSDAAGTLWLDVGARRWSEAVLAATELRTEHMPRVFEGPEEAGRLRPEVASAWGMRRVPVVAGAGDNAAGAIAMGVIADGDAMLSLGTSGVVFVAIDGYRANATTAVHTFCHCLPGLWHQMAVQLSAASCLEWAARLTGTADVGQLLGRAEARGAVGVPELFLPYLSGERTPYNDPHARGALIGLSHESDAAAVTQAVLEGVAMAVADGVDALAKAGARIGRLNVIGGGARSRYWGRILAAALDAPLTYRAGGEVGPALGAARLARLHGLGGSPAEQLAPPPVEFVLEPQARDVAVLRQKQARFRAAYQSLRPLFRE